MTNNLHIGAIYTMHHCRKGSAVVEVLAIDDPWIDCRVVVEHLQGLGRGSYRGTGDEVRVRDCLARFVLIRDAAAQEVKQ